MAKTFLFWDPLSDNILQERDESGALVAQYTAEPGLYGDVISQHRVATESQFHFDAQGSTLAVTDESEMVSDTRAYSAFGEATESSSSTIFPFQYIGRKGYYNGTASERYYVRRRVYDPTRSRWLSIDPSALDSPVNAFMYCSLSPLTRVDPSGLVSLTLNPSTEASMDWVAVVELVTIGNVGETVATIALDCSCKPALWRRRLRRPINGCRLECTISASFTIFVHSKLIDELRTSAEPEFVEMRREHDRLGIPLPTIRGVYGHEQLHVRNIIALLRSLSGAISNSEGLSSCCNCNTRLASLYKSAARQLCQIYEGEAHGATYPINFQTPANMVDYPPTGNFPANPAHTVRDRPPRGGVAAGGSAVNCSREPTSPTPEPPVIQIPM